MMIVLAFAGTYAVLAPTTSAHMVTGLSASFVALLCCSAWLRGTNRGLVLIALAAASGVTVAAPLVGVPDDTGATLRAGGTWVLTAGIVSTAAYAIARGRPSPPSRWNRLLLGSALVHVALAGGMVGLAMLRSDADGALFEQAATAWFYMGWLPALSISTLWLSRARPERATFLGWLFVGVAVAPALLFGAVQANVGATHAAVTVFIGIACSAALAGVFTARQST